MIISPSSLDINLSQLLDEDVRLNRKNNGETSVWLWCRNYNGTVWRKLTVSIDLLSGIA